jgi:hypothetical protein
VIPPDRATPIEGEKVTIGVDELAKILRTNAAAIPSRNQNAGFSDAA